MLDSRLTAEQEQLRKTVEECVVHDHPVARHFRESKILEIGEGTTKVQRMLIARELGL